MQRQLLIPIWCCLLVAWLQLTKCNEVTHIASTIDLTSGNVSMSFHDLKRLFSSIFAFSRFQEVASELQYHTCIYYDEPTYDLKFSSSKSLYASYLSEKYHPNLVNTNAGKYVKELIDLGLDLVYIPIQDISIYPNRFLLESNRNDLLNLFCGLYLGRKLLTDSSHFQYHSHFVPGGKSYPDSFQDTFLNKPYTDYIIFIHSDFLVTNNHIVRYLQTHRSEALQFDFHCLPSLPKLSNTFKADHKTLNASYLLAENDNLQNLYDFRLYYLKVQLSIPLWLYLHSALLTNTESISTLLQSAIRSLSEVRAIRLIDREEDHLNIVYAQQTYLTPRSLLPGSTEEIDSVALLEIDNENHRVLLNQQGNCTLALHLEWMHYNTLTVFQKTLEAHLNDNEQKWNQFTGCEAICFNSNCHGQWNLRNKREQVKRAMQQKEDPSLFFYNELLSFNQNYLQRDVHLSLFADSPTIVKDSPSSKSSNVPKNPSSSGRLFDCLLFFNELALLKLRLQLLSPLVHRHVIVESRFTFTGKAKSLLLTEQLSFFTPEERSKLIVIILDHLPFPSPQTIGEIWQNEYYSRNYAYHYLAQRSNEISLQPHDLFLIGDTDELLDPEILLLLLSNFHYSTLQMTSNRPIINNPSAPLLNGHSPLRLRHLLYKFPRSEYLYDFDCYLNTLWNYYPTTSPTVTLVTYGEALDLFRRSRKAGENPDDSSSLFFFLRNYLQYQAFFPYDSMVSDAVWHFSFFQMTVEEMRLKLASYSHQNFASQFFGTDQTKQQQQQKVEEERVVPSDSSQKVYRDQDPIPKGEISLEKIRERLQEQSIINGQAFEKKHRPNLLYHWLEKTLLECAAEEERQEQSLFLARLKKRLEGRLTCEPRPFRQKEAILKKMLQQIEQSIPLNATVRIYS